MLTKSPEFHYPAPILPRFFYAKKRLGKNQRLHVAERPGFRLPPIPHQSRCCQTPPEPATLLWPIGVPFSRQAQYPLEFKVQRLDREHGMSAHPTNCLTMKGLPTTALNCKRWRGRRLPSWHRVGRPPTPTRVASYISRTPAGARSSSPASFSSAVLRRPKRSILIAQVQRAHRCLGAGRTAPTTAVRAHLHGRQRCELLDRSISKRRVTLQAVSYGSSAEFFNSKGEPLSDHNPAVVGFHRRGQRDRTVTVIANWFCRRLRRWWYPLPAVDRFRCGYGPMRADRNAESASARECGHTSRQCAHR